MKEQSAPGIRMTDADSSAVWSLQHRIVAFSYTMLTSATDELKVTAYNNDLALFAHPALYHGAALDVTWGYPGQMATPRRVFLEGFRGFTELELTFSGRERPLNQTAKTHAWLDRKVAAVVREIAQSNGFTAANIDVDEVPTESTVVQAAETDAALLKRLAEAHGFEFFVDGLGFHWRAPRKSQAPSVELVYGAPDGSILDISFGSNLMRHVGSVAVRSRDPLQRRTVEAKANTETVARDTLGQAIEVYDPERYQTAHQRDNAKAAIHPSSAGSLEAATTEAATRFDSAESMAFEATVSLVGIPTLCARQLVRLSGVSTYLSGNYYVQQACHSITDAGYITELQIIRDGAGATEKSAPQGGRHNDQPAPQPGMKQLIEIYDTERYQRSRLP